MNTIPIMKILCSLSVVLLGLICASGPTYAQTETEVNGNAESSAATEPNLTVETEKEVVEISLGEGQPPLRLIPLPRRSNISPLTSQQERPPYELGAVYLAETELSLAQLKALLSDESWKTYQEQLLLGKATTTKFKYLREAVQNGSGDYPALQISLAQIVEATESLAKDFGLPPANYDPQLEKFVFRLPTKTEWQYAARAIDKPTDLSGKLHFPRWPVFDASINGQVTDMLVRLEKGENPAPYQDQSRFLQLIDEFYQGANGDRAGFNLLGRILQHADSLGFEVNIAKTSESIIRPCLAETPNPWGFHRMFGNVAEWVTVQPTSDAGDRYWETLAGGKLSELKKQFGSDFGLVMGGSFMSLEGYSGVWKRYSAVYGSPFDESGDRPLSIDDCQQDIRDYNAGVRLAVSRALADDWFVTMRNEFLLDPQGEPGSENGRVHHRFQGIMSLRARCAKRTDRSALPANRGEPQRLSCRTMVQLFQLTQNSQQTLRSP